MPPGEVDDSANSQAAEGEGGGPAPDPAGHTPLWHYHQVVNVDVCIPVLSNSLHSSSGISAPGAWQPR